MGKSTGFLEYERVENAGQEPLERIKTYREFHTPLSDEERRKQGARCMDCGVPFCQAGKPIFGMVSGCPLNNLCPEWNDMVYNGFWEEAADRLLLTNCFPEFTSRVCPALCEKACTCGLNGDPVTVKENEYAIIEKAFASGHIKANPPKVRTGKRVAVVGSGPSGLAAALQLNKRGHHVTVFEREDRVGGLLMYGIPNMKLEKTVVQRRVDMMQEEGVEFRTSVDVGKDISAEQLLKEYDAVILACGSSNPRNINADGRDADGIYYAVDFLKATTKSLINSNLSDGYYISAKYKNVIVIGGGPGGLAAAISAHENGAHVLLIEREARLGGMLKQCIHDGFGLARFGERLAGPEYVERFIDRLEQLQIEARTQTFVTRVEKSSGGFAVYTVSRDGVARDETRTLVLATGCRERTAKQVFIHGTRPAGVFTAGTAQNFTNLLGELPARRCVILGSGDIGLIMARRLTLEGAEVLGVYEAKPTPSGLTRNIHQCLHDYDIPLHLSHTVTRVFGADRLTGVEVAEVDAHMRPITGTEQRIDCDALIVSVGLIPENELAESLGVPLDGHTRGPVCDGQLMTEIPGIFSCGNALHVNDLVDYVSASGELAGKSAAHFAAHTRDELAVTISNDFGYLVPQRLDRTQDNSAVTLYFRSAEVLGACRVVLTIDGNEVWSRRYPFLRPPEMQQLTLDFDKLGIADASDVHFEIEVAEA